MNDFGSTVGRIVSGRDVELAALATLKAWSSTYLAEAERQTGREVGSLPRVRTWTTSPDFEKWPEDQLPCVLLISPGLVDPPDADGAGKYRARFSLGIANIASTATADETADVAKLYCAAHRTCLLQHPSLDGFAAGVTWLDENYDDLPFDDTRSLGAGKAIFAVEVRDISTRYRGPQDPVPDLEPIPEDPTATSYEIETHQTFENHIPPPKPPDPPDPEDLPFLSSLFPDASGDDVDTPVRAYGDRFTPESVLVFHATSSADVFDMPTTFVDSTTVDTVMPAAFPTDFYGVRVRNGAWESAEVLTYNKYTL